MANLKGFSKVVTETVFDDIPDIVDETSGVDVIEVLETGEVVDAPESVAPVVVEPKAEEMRTLTPEQDLRVVTKDQVVLYLFGGVPRQLALSISYEAIRCAAEQGIELKVE